MLRKFLSIFFFIGGLLFIFSSAEFNFTGFVDLSAKPTQADKDGNLQDIGESWLQKIHSQSDKDKPNPSTTQPSTSGESSAEPKQVTESETAKPTAPRPVDGFSDRLSKQSTNEATNKAPSFMGSLMRLVVLLLVLVFVLYFIVRVLRSRGVSFRKGDELVHVLVNIPLVQGKFLQVVDVAGKLLVLGVSEAGVQLLTSIDDGISADRIRLWQSQQKKPQVDPASLGERFIAILKGTDFRFWDTDRQGKASSPSFADSLDEFRSVLPEDEAKQVVGPRRTKTTQRKTRELKKLLQQQKQRLSQGSADEFSS